MTLVMGTLAGIVDKMQTRARLYELLGYGDCNRFDAGTFGVVLVNVGDAVAGGLVKPV